MLSLGNELSIDAIGRAERTTRSLAWAAACHVFGITPAPEAMTMDVHGADKTDNPYLPPRAESLDDSATFSLQADHDCLVVHHKALLPRRCIITNQPASESDRVTEHHRWGKPFGLMLTRKRLTVSFYVNAAERKRRLRRQVLFAALVALGVAMLLVSIIVPAGKLLLTGSGAILFLLGSRWHKQNRYLEIVRHERGLFWIRGCSQAYLAQRFS